MSPALARRHLVVLALVAVLGGCSTVHEDSFTGAPPSPVAAVPAQALNPDVRQETIQQTICVSGYSASVRPSTSFTKGVKLKLLREASLPAERAREFELDHRVALALGGHARALENLTLQPWDGDSGAKRKDRLERALHKLVCAGKLTLVRAQRALYFDWEAAYGEFVEGR